MTLFFTPFPAGGGGISVCFPVGRGLGGGGGAFEELVACFESSSYGTFPLMRYRFRIGS